MNENGNTQTDSTFFVPFVGSSHYRNRLNTSTGNGHNRGNGNRL